MTQWVSRSIKVLLSVGITAAFIVYVYINRHSIFGTLANIKAIYLIPVFAGQLGIQLSNAALLKDTLLPLKTDIPYTEAFRLTLVASFINFFTPVVGGASLRAVYLKREHKLPYSSFIGVIYANYLIIFLVTFLAGLIALLTVPGAIGKDAGRALAVFFGCGTAASAVFMAWAHKLTGLLKNASIKNRFLKKAAEKITLVDEGWDAIRSNKKALAMMPLWSAATMLSVAVLYWGAMKSVSLATGVDVAVVFAALAVVGLLFNITPGSIGIKEGIYASIYTITAVSAQHVVSFSLVDRITQLLILGLGWSFFSRRIINGVGFTRRT